MPKFRHILGIKFKQNKTLGRKMKILLKNANVYTPKNLGIKDVLVENGKILKIGKIKDENYEIIDCTGKIVCPMFVDGHEHLLGNYWDAEGIICAGVGSLVCVLSNESEPKYVDKIIEIAKRLKKEYKIDAYCLAGSKNYVENTSEYILNNQNVIGIKTALFQPQRPKPNLSYEKLLQDSISTYEAGKKSGKTVQVHIHLDNPFARGEKVSWQEIDSGKLDNLGWIDKIVKETNVPYSLFKLTHAKKYYNRILEYAAKGCYIDYTAISGEYDKRLDPLVNAIKQRKIDMAKISISSDLGIGVMEQGLSGKEYPTSLLNTIQQLVKQGLKFEDVLPFVTTNPGKLLGENCGKICEGEQCKILILNKSLEIEQIIMDSNIIYQNKIKAT